jgi:hypothetical protein
VITGSSAGSIQARWDVVRRRRPRSALNATVPAPLTAVTDRLQELLPNVGRLNIAGASHNMFKSHPAEFNAGVTKFISQH